MLQTILTWITGLFSGNSGMIPAVIAFNAVLSAVGAFLAAINQSTAAGWVQKASSAAKWVVDLLQGNLAHK